MIASLPVTLTAVADTSGYEPGCIIPPVQIDESLPSGETAVLSFSRDEGFTADCRIAYYESGWIPLASSLSADLGSISAVVDHFSVWGVIEVVPTGPVDVSGTATIDMGSDWNTAFGTDLAGKTLSVMLIDAGTGDLVPGAVDSAVSTDWSEPEAGVYSFGYTLADIEQGNYIVFATIDMDDDGAIDLDEPAGVYLGETDWVLAVAEGEDVTGVDVTLTTYTLSGTVDLDDPLVGDYSGEDICIQLLTSDEYDDLVPARYTVSGPAVVIGSAFPCSYSVSGVPGGLYLLSAFVDIVADGEFVMEDGEPFGIWEYNVDGDTGEIVVAELYENIDPADILIDTVNYAPTVEITTPVDVSTQEDLIFEVSGTATDDLDDLTGAFVEVAVFYTADVISHDDGEFGADPVWEGSAEVGAVGDWSLPALDLSSVGFGEYSIFAWIEDSMLLTGGSYARITIENIITAEGTPGSPLDIAVGVTHAGEVDTTASYYHAAVTTGESYLASVIEPTDGITFWMFEDVDFTTSLLMGAEKDTNTKAISLTAESGDLYFKVFGQATAAGAEYGLLVEPLTETVTLSGTVTIDGTFPATNPMYITLSDGHGAGTLEEHSLVLTAVAGESEVEFTMSGVRPGYYTVYAFIDENENGVWDYATVNEYQGNSATDGHSNWYMEDTTGITFEVMVEEF